MKPIKLNKFSDEEMLAHWQDFKYGNDDSLGLIYQQYFSALFAYGLKLTNNKTIVQDSIQDVFLDLFKYRKTLSSPNSVKFYLFSSLRNKIFKVKPVSENIALENIELETPVFDLLINETEEDIYKILPKLVSMLPLNQQEVIKLKYRDDFSWEEIGALLNIHPQSARNILSRALASIRKKNILKKLS